MLLCVCLYLSKGSINVRVDSFRWCSERHFMVVVGWWWQEVGNSFKLMVVVVVVVKLDAYYASKEK